MNVADFRNDKGNKQLVADPLAVSGCRSCRPTRGALFETALCKLGAGLPRKDRRVARPEGFEPPTEEVEAPCSIQLSYGRADVAAFSAV